MSGIAGMARHAPVNTKIKFNIYFCIGRRSSVFNLSGGYLIAEARTADISMFPDLDSIIDEIIIWNEEQIWVRKLLPF